MRVRSGERRSRHLGRFDFEHAEHFVALVVEGVRDALRLVEVDSVGIECNPRGVVALLLVGVELDVEPNLAWIDSRDFIGEAPRGSVTLHGIERLDCRPTERVFENEHIRRRTKACDVDEEEELALSRAEASRLIDQTVAIIVDQIARPLRLIRVGLRVGVIAIGPIFTEHSESIHVSVLTEGVVITVGVGGAITVVVPTIATDFGLWCAIVETISRVCALEAELESSGADTHSHSSFGSHVTSLPEIHRIVGVLVDDCIAIVVECVARLGSCRQRFTFAGSPNTVGAGRRAAMARTHIFGPFGSRVTVARQGTNVAFTFIDVGVAVIVEQVAELR